MTEHWGQFTFRYCLDVENPGKIRVYIQRQPDHEGRTCDSASSHPIVLRCRRAAPHLHKAGVHARLHHRSTEFGAPLGEMHDQLHSDGIFPRLSGRDIRWLCAYTQLHQQPRCRICESLACNLISWSGCPGRNSNSRSCTPSHVPVQDPSLC